MKSLSALLGKPRTKKQIEGQTGENQALDYLIRQGLALVERNFRCKSGEIDLVMRHNGTLVFVEVRKRSHAGYGGAAASVDRSKQARLLSAAQVYLQQLRHVPPCRFDVVAIDGADLNWICNAFQA